jgi:hypothetical protein
MEMEVVQVQFENLEPKNEPGKYGFILVARIKVPAKTIPEAMDASNEAMKKIQAAIDAI